LPGAHFGVSTIFPNQLDISLHDGLGAFELWREALGIPADAVKFSARNTAMNLKATTTFAGATVELIGYADPLPNQNVNGGAR